jgi:hypothetical protein
MVMGGKLLAQLLLGRLASGFNFEREWTSFRLFRLEHSQTDSDFYFHRIDTIVFVYPASNKTNHA